jgi:hypothetical protein
MSVKLRASNVLRLLAITCGSAALSSTLRADVITLGASRDNTLYFDPAGTISNGAGGHIFAGMTAADTQRRALLAFDVAGAIPAGSKIDSASLTLHMSKTITSGIEVTLHRLLADWGEGASIAPGEEGGGAQAAPGDATWKHTFYDTQTWSTPGGDFDRSASATQLVFGPGFYSWSSAAMAQDVQGWLDDPGQSFGWLVLGDESSIATAKRFDSRENPEPALRPALTVAYTPIPEPASAGAITLAALIIVRRR